MEIGSGVKSEDRAPALLEALHLPIVGRRGRGRYVTSPTAMPGVSYWATSLPRFRRDGFGVQFDGAEHERLRLLKPALVRAGFVDRGAVDDRVTFERPLPFAPDAGIDVEGLQAAHREATAILEQEAGGPDRRMTFLEFMQASPLYGVELDLPERTIDPERPSPF